LPNVAEASGSDEEGTDHLDEEATDQVDEERPKMVTELKSILKNPSEVKSEEGNNDKREAVEPYWKRVQSRPSGDEL
jgi:hypothetical protein